jgi:hypothetical protein
MSEVAVLLEQLDSLLLRSGVKFDTESPKPGPDRELVKEVFEWLGIEASEDLIRYYSWRTFEGCISTFAPWFVPRSLFSMVEERRGILEIIESNYPPAARGSCPSPTRFDRSCVPIGDCLPGTLFLSTNGSFKGVRLWHSYQTLDEEETVFGSLADLFERVVDAYRRDLVVKPVSPEQWLEFLPGHRWPEMG